MTPWPPFIFWTIGWLSSPLPERKPYDRLYCTASRPPFSVPRRVWLLLLGLILLIVAGVFWARHVYNVDLQAPSSSQVTQIVTIKSGSTVKQIADQLETAHLIRSAWAFDLYIHSKVLNNNLQTGTYALSPNQDVAEIVSTLTKGKVTTSVVTILPGRRIDQVRADLINDGYSPADVDAALTPDQYADVSVLAFKPASVSSLEGLLWPDSFTRRRVLLRRQSFANH